MDGNYKATAPDYRATDVTTKQRHLADPYTKMTVEPRAFDWCVVLLCSEQWFARKWPLSGTFDADGWQLQSNGT